MNQKINFLMFLFLILNLSYCGGGSGGSGNTSSLDPNFNLSNAAGSYSGTYSGADSGNWTLTVNADGTASGYFGGLPASGTVSDKGEVNLTVENGDSTVTISGTINGTSLNASWNGGGGSGSISGSKEGSDNINSPSPSSVSFVGSYSGEYNVKVPGFTQGGTWRFDIDEEGNLTGYIGRDEMSGSMNGDGEFTFDFTFDDGTTATVNGSITNDDGSIVVSGEWSGEGVGNGTFAGGKEGQNSPLDNDLDDDDDNIDIIDDDDNDGEDIPEDCELICKTFGNDGCELMGFEISCENNEEDAGFDDICNSDGNNQECFGHVTFPSTNHSYFVDAIFDFDTCTIDVNVEGLGSCQGDAAQFIAE